MAFWVIFWLFYLLKIGTNCHFLTPSPPLSDYVVYEWAFRVGEIMSCKKTVIFFQILQMLDKIKEKVYAFQQKLA